MSIDSMYQEEILDHYRHPRNRGRLEKPSVHVHENNPLCGDIIDIYMDVGKDRTIKRMTFDGNGCAISQAAASMLTEHFTGKNIDDVIKADKQLVFDMLGIPLSPIRVKCALLAFKAAKVGAVDFLSKK